jgi:hypothetical protein
MNRWLAPAQLSAVALLVCAFGSAAQAAPQQIHSRAITVDFVVAVPIRIIGPPDGRRSVLSRAVFAFAIF